MPPRKTSKKVNKPKKASKIIRLIYLYIMSAVTFIVFLIGAIGLVNIGVKTFIFHVEDYGYNYSYDYCNRYTYTPKMIDPEGEIETEADSYIKEEYENCLKEQKEKQEKMLVSPQVARDLSIGIAQVLIAFPLWIFHWRKIERERKTKS